MCRDRVKGVFVTRFKLDWEMSKAVYGISYTALLNEVFFFVSGKGGVLIRDWKNKY